MPDVSLRWQEAIGAWRTDFTGGWTWTSVRMTPERKGMQPRTFPSYAKMAMAILALDQTKLPMSRKKQNMALNEQYFREMMEKVSKKKEL